MNQLDPQKGIVTDSQLPKFDRIQLLIIFHYAKCDPALCHQIYSIYSVKQLQHMQQQLCESWNSMIIDRLVLTPEKLYSKNKTELHSLLSDL